MKGINQATNPCIESPSDHPQERTSKERPSLLQELKTNAKTIGTRQRMPEIFQYLALSVSDPDWFRLSWIRIRIRMGMRIRIKDKEIDQN
jgi:hypothetical protein